MSLSYRSRGRLRSTLATVAVIGSAALVAIAAGPASATALTVSAEPAANSSTTSTPADRTGPPQPNILVAGAYSALQPTISPPGTNDWSCKPSAAHPNPIVLSNGTGANAYDDWAGLSGALADAGYCVYVPNLGGPPGSPIQTIGPIEDTAQGLSSFADKVLVSTRAAKVDVIGHSQGGMNPRYWIKNLGGATKIGKLIALAPSNHGTNASGLLTAIDALPGGAAALQAGCPACSEQTAGSAFLTKLNAGGETVTTVSYTVLESKYDEVVTPYTSAFLAAGPNVKNVLLQDVCGLDYVDHLGITYDPIVKQLVLNTLDPAHAKTPTCQYVPPVLG